MFKKIMNNPAGSIVVQLRVIVAVLAIFSAFNLATLYPQTDSAFDDGRAINFTGIIRGKAQRLVKLALLQGRFNQFETEDRAENDFSSGERPILNGDVQQKIDDVIPLIDQIVLGLINGDKELGLNKLSDPNFQT
ncbi:MAG: hypothetical protein AAFW75_25525, partial [Cyanobacteria bacterium J06636_16]